MASAGEWISLREAFLDLQRRCAGDSTATVCVGRLSAVWNVNPAPGQWWLHLNGDRNEGGIIERFTLHAQAGARLLEFEGNENDALPFWLHRVRLSTPPAHVRPLRGVLPNEQTDEFVELTDEGIEILDICLMSADHCLTCIAQPDLTRLPVKPAEPEGKLAAVVEPPKTAKSQSALVPQFPKRAEWLRARLAEREWNKHTLQLHGGPEHRTTQKFLDGLSVQLDVLRKIVIGLQSKLIHKGHQLPPVSESEIPSD